MIVKSFISSMFSNSSILINLQLEVDEIWISDYIDIYFPFIGPDILILPYFLWSLMYLLCLTLIKRWLYQLFWNASQFNLICSSRVWKMLKLHHVTPGKCILAIILKDQSTLNNWCFTRYGKLYNFVIIRTPKNIKLYF